MTRNVGTTDYVGASGGYEVPNGFYIGRAGGPTILSTSGNFNIMSQNGDVNITASGNINIATYTDLGTELISIGAPHVNLSAQHLELTSFDFMELKANIGKLDITAVEEGGTISVLGSRPDSNGNGGGIVLSTATRQIFNLYGHASISGVAGRNMDLLASGAMRIRSDNGNVSTFASGTTLIDSIGSTTVRSSVSTIINSDVNTQITATSAVLINPLGVLFAVAGGAVFLASAQSDTTVTSQNYTASTIIRHEAGPVKFQPWNGSGQMEYLFGPNEGWAVKPSYLSTFQPIPYSGQIRQMILEIPSLQSVYQVNNLLNVVSAEGNLGITAVTAKPVFGSNSAQPELNISGQLNGPTTNHEVGDLWSVIHQQGSGLLPDDVTTAALVRAKSLGRGTLMLNTGSGIANISIGSGMINVTNASTQSFNSLTPAVVLWSTHAPSGVSDLGYGVSNGTQDVAILVPGLYRLAYKLNTKLSTAGSGSAVLRSEIHRQRPGALTTTTLVHSKCYAVPTRSTTLGKSTLACSDVYFNADANDLMSVRIAWDTAVSGNVVDTILGECFFAIEYIGPKRN